MYMAYIHLIIVWFINTGKLNIMYCTLCTVYIFLLWKRMLRTVCVIMSLTM